MRRLLASLGAVWLAVLPGCASPTIPAGDAELSGTMRLARTAFEQEALPEAISFYERALKRARVLDDPTAIGDAAYNLALCMLARGDCGRARAYLRDAEVELRRGHDDLADVILLQAKAAHLRGEREEALRLVDQLFSDPASTPREDHRAQAAIIRGNLACDAGDAAAAKETLEEAGKWTEESSSFRLRAAAEKLRGRINLLEKNPEGAAKAFGDEAALLQRAGRYHAMAEALSRAGDAYRASGDAAAGSELYFRAARTSFAQGERQQALQWVAMAQSLAEKNQDDGKRESIRGLREEILEEIAAESGSEPTTGNDRKQVLPDPAPSRE